MGKTQIKMTLDPKLYLTAISSCGNELRLSSHEAPPRIISAFLGESVTLIVDGQEVKTRGNLKVKLPNLPYDLSQENTDETEQALGLHWEQVLIGSSEKLAELSTANVSYCLPQQPIQLKIWLTNLNQDKPM